jgi:spore maturation protein CgeB
MLKLLIVSRKERSRSFATLFDGISKSFDTTVIKLSKEEIRDFANTVKRLSCHKYDRVMFDVPLRRIGNDYTVLKKISGLILYEEDAYQEFVKRSEYYKKYTKIYREISETSGCRLILTGYNIGRRIRETGLDVVVIPKAFDENHLRDLGKERNIELGFVGRVKNKIYKERQSFLGRLQKEKGLKLFKTDPGEEYLQALNEISIFVSADIGLLEYMAKNFEAMGSGCVVLAKRQGGEEEAKLGLRHLENIILYDNYEDAAQSVDFLLENEEKLESIRTKGLDFVNKRHTLSHRIDDFREAIKAPIEPSEISPRNRLKGFLRKWI